MPARPATRSEAHCFETRRGKQPRSVLGLFSSAGPPGDPLGFAWRGSVLAGALIGASCLPPTEVTLELTTDALCVDVTETSIATGRLAGLDERPATTATQACDETTQRIGDIVVVPSRTKDGEFALRVVTGLAMTADDCVANGYRGGCIVARRALRFVPRENLKLRIPMETVCIDVPCEATETCRNGACYPAALPEGCLDPLDCLEAVGGAGGGTGGAMTGAGGTTSGGGTGGMSPGGAGGEAAGRSDTGGVASTGGARVGGAGGATRGGTAGTPLDQHGGAGGTDHGETSGAAGAPTGVSGGTGTGGTAGAGRAGAAGHGFGGETPGTAGQGGVGGAGGAARGRVVVTTAADTLDGDPSSLEALALAPGADAAISLREAMTACNSTPNGTGPDVIEFAIPGDPPHVIVVVDTALPTITDAVFIDGHSQTGYSGAPVVELDGTSPTLVAGTENGLYLTAGSDGSTVRGLAIHGFPDSGILLETAGGHVIQNNYVGLRADGTTWARNLGRHGISVQNSSFNQIGGSAFNSDDERNVVGRASWQGIVINGALSQYNVVSGNIVGLNAFGTARARNVRNGIHISNGASFNTIGGADSTLRNTLSGNGQNGLRLIDRGTQGNVVQNNYIGSDPQFSAVSSLGNAGVGLFVGAGAHDNLLGGDGPELGNRIRYNGGRAIALNGGLTVRNAIIGNQIYGGSGGLGIDLNNDSVVTPNDTGDGDSGTNDLLNFPELVAAAFASDSVTIDYDLDVPAGEYRVEFYGNPTPNPLGYGDASWLLAVETIVHAGTGAERFTTTFPCGATEWLTASTTELLPGGGFGSTSELSAAVPTSYP